MPGLRDKQQWGNHPPAGRLCETESLNSVRRHGSRVIAMMIITEKNKQFILSSFFLVSYSNIRNGFWCRMVLRPQAVTVLRGGLEVLSAPAINRGLVEL